MTDLTGVGRQMQGATANDEAIPGSDGRGSRGDPTYCYGAQSSCVVFDLKPEHKLRAHDCDVIQTPTRVTKSPTNIATVSGSENIIHAQSMVTGGLR